MLMLRQSGFAAKATKDKDEQDGPAKKGSWKLSPPLTGWLIANVRPLSRVDPAMASQTRRLLRRISINHAPHHRISVEKALRTGMGLLTSEKALWQPS